MYGAMLTQAEAKFRRQLLNKLLLFANLTQSNLINTKEHVLQEKFQAGK